jgi:Fe-S-cluster containining protein
MSDTVDLETALLGPLVPARECGACTVCCDALKIDTPDFQKPAGTPCIHLGGHGCAVHAVRPDVCRAWFCGWRRMGALPDAARPDRSGLLVSLDIEREPRNCLEGVSIVVRSLGGQAGFESETAEDILDELCGRLVPVWLNDGARKVLVHPESDVAHYVISGEAPPAELREEVGAWSSRYGMFRR